MKPEVLPSRLFWKLVLALFMSMALTLMGGLTYFVFSGRSPPLIAEEDLLFGIIPAVPFLSALFAILVVGLSLAWYLSRPLIHLRWALRQAAQGHLDSRVSPLMRGRRDEITDLAHDFDKMAEQLQNALDSQRTLLHDVSHELRSPLTRLQVAIGLMRQDPTLTEEMTARILSESEKLNDLLEELLTLHRLEAGAPGTTTERVDLVELLQAITDDAEFEAKSEGRHVSLRAQESFVAQVHGELIYRAFENVIRNAVKYTPKGSSVEVHAFKDMEGFSVVVADRGPGVPAEMLTAIFEPFVRLENSQSIQGLGLGLAITRRAMLMHGGQVKAEAREGGGLIVRLTFPATMQLDDSLLA